MASSIRLIATPLETASNSPDTRLHPGVRPSARIRGVLYPSAILGVSTDGGETGAKFTLEILSMTGDLSVEVGEQIELITGQLELLGRLKVVQIDEICS